VCMYCRYYQYGRFGMTLRAYIAIFLFNIGIIMRSL
jgi:hypothetical protein